MNKNTFSSEDKQGISPKNANPTLFNLSGFNKKPVEVRFSLDETSSDGGLLLLNEIDKQIGLCEKCLVLKQVYNKIVNLFAHYGQKKD